LAGIYETGKKCAADFIENMRIVFDEQPLGKLIEILPPFDWLRANGVLLARLCFTVTPISSAWEWPKNPAILRHSPRFGSC